MKRMYRNTLAVLLVLVFVFTTNIAAFAEEMNVGNPQTNAYGDEGYPGDDLTGEDEPGLPFDDEPGADDDADSDIDDEAAGAEAEEDEDGSIPDDEGLGAGDDDGAAVTEGGEKQPKDSADVSPVDENAIASASEKLRQKTASGMALNAEMRKAKAEMAAFGLFKSVSRLQADVDYVNHELVYATESESEADNVAAAYNGVVTSFSEGIAVIKVAADTVDAIEKAEDADNDFPAVYPNYIYKLNSVSYTKEEIDAAKEANGLADEGVDADGTATDDPEELVWEFTAEPADGEGLDEGLSDEEEAAILEELDTVFDRGDVSESDIAAMDMLGSRSLLTDADLEGFEMDSSAQAKKPNDKYVSKQWYLETIGAYNSGSGKTAWDYSKGSGVKVAVIDSGICAGHPDLKKNISGAYYTAKHAYNKGADNDGHGSHVAGIIAAEGGNKIGISGVAPKAKIISIKALDLYWFQVGSGWVLETAGSTADIVRAVNMAVSKGAQVVNMSLGGKDNDPVYASAIAKAISKGVVIVAAAGNDNANINLAGNNTYPAMFPNVICVAATMKNGARATYSNTSNGGHITIAAPGGANPNTEPDKTQWIASTYKANSYAWMSGTSMAAPVVTGVVALLLAQNSAYKNCKTADRVTYITNVLRSTATTAGVPAYSVNSHGAGIVNAAAATAKLADVITPPTLTGSNSGGATFAGGTITTTNTTGNATVNIGGGPAGAVYHYTLNGKAPTLASTKGTSVVLDCNGKKSITVKAVSCVNGKLSAVTTATYKIDVQISGITLASKSGTAAVGLGKKLTLAPTFLPSKPTNKGLTWESANTGVATVDSKGVVTAKMAGTSVIRATSKEPSAKFATFTVSVHPLTTKVEVAPKTVKLSTVQYTLDGVTVPAFVPLVVTPSPAGAGTNGAATGAANFTFSTSNKKVATVNAAGRVDAVGSGKATITVKARDGSGKKATCAVTVVKPAKITSVTCKQGQPAAAASPYSYAVGVGKTINLTAVLEDKKATNTKVVWQATNGTGAATVSAGKVKGVSAGTATVTVKAADGVNAAAVINITVKPVATTLVSTLMDKTPLYIYPATPTPSIPWSISSTPGGVHNQYVFTTKNKKVATVASTGANSATIRGVGKGKTTVTATATDGSGKKKTITIEVLKPVQSITVKSIPTDGIAYGKSMKFSVNVTPKDATNKKLKWAVSNTEYFKVDSSGKVTVKKKTSTASRASTAISVGTADGSIAPQYLSNTGSMTPLQTNALRVRAFNDAFAGVFFGNNGNVLTKKYTSYSMKEGSRTKAINPSWYQTTSWWPDICLDARIIRSSNDRVADYEYNSVSKTWELVAYSPGTTTITIKTLDGSNKSAKLKVTVKARGDKL